MFDLDEIAFLWNLMEKKYVSKIALSNLPGGTYSWHPKEHALYFRLRDPAKTQALVVKPCLCYLQRK